MFIVSTVLLPAVRMYIALFGFSAQNDCSKNRYETKRFEYHPLPYEVIDRIFQDK